MEDIVLVTADSVRADFVDEMDFISSLNSWNGSTVGHYTRPSLAALLSSNYLSALQSAVAGPTVAEVLSKQGYETIGLAPSPQLDELFDFDRGFDKYENFVSPGTRGNSWRERLSQIDLLRKAYHRFFPPHAKQSHLPPDSEIVDTAIERFNSANSPRFMWVHLMGTHRPYGRGEEAVSKKLDRKALFSPESLTNKEVSEIKSKYRKSLARVDSEIQRLYTELNSDPTLLFTSDHGDEFGEEGYYFHQPQRMRTVDALTSVPIACNKVNVSEKQFSLLDIAPMIATIGDTDPSDSWDGTDPRESSRDYTLTIAPWQDEASIRFRDVDRTIVSDQGTVSINKNGNRMTLRGNDRSAEVQKQLRDLGYIS